MKNGWKEFIASQDWGELVDLYLESYSNKVKKMTKNQLVKEYLNLHPHESESDIKNEPKDFLQYSIQEAVYELANNMDNEQLVEAIGYESIQSYYEFKEKTKLTGKVKPGDQFIVEIEVKPK
jgi:hypothetical protein